MNPDHIVIGKYVVYTHPKYGYGTHTGYPSNDQNDHIYQITSVDYHKSIAILRNEKGMVRYVVISSPVQYFEDLDFLLMRRCYICQRTCINSNYRYICDKCR